MRGDGFVLGPELAEKESQPVFSLAEQNVAQIGATAEDGEQGRQVGARNFIQSRYAAAFDEAREICFGERWGWAVFKKR